MMTDDSTVSIPQGDNKSTTQHMHIVLSSGSSAMAGGAAANSADSGTQRSDHAPFPRNPVSVPLTRGISLWMMPLPAVIHCTPPGPMTPCKKRKRRTH